MISKHYIHLSCKHNKKVRVQDGNLRCSERGYGELHKQRELGVQEEVLVAERK